ncbi:hypothetical protein HN858_04570 [Candidatus Falkowbacteria bacterium]|nr:hypothetical protein [Candidatus Falkowbacteria bacterium]MBT5503858.1 hypothetical protein [Candidatus Falkowbacteria bacterium]MBT6574401.1 hypothetical protein [Candidatus Falkowbacteria bacterium]MBT7348918.1 hypothetical protein [Candidatus Falkowbacteria bacterium]MBT7501274.1 hypothetical protein [Candidatus Falkowbacteria bacterium]
MNTGMQFGDLHIKRHKGQLPMSTEFVRCVNSVTARSFGQEVPLVETFEHLGESNLGHFVFNCRDQLIGYSLNNLFQTNVSGLDGARVNYFASAFVLPEARRKLAIYKLLASTRLEHNEDFLMVRTQSPIVMSYFAWVCEIARMTLITPLDRVPTEVLSMVFESFSRNSLIHPKVYGRCLTKEPLEPKTSFTKDLMEGLHPEQGDALVLIGRK